MRSSSARCGRARAARRGGRGLARRLRAGRSDASVGDRGADGEARRRRARRTTTPASPGPPVAISPAVEQPISGGAVLLGADALEQAREVVVVAAEDDEELGLAPGDGRLGGFLSRCARVGPHGAADPDPALFHVSSHRWVIGGPRRLFRGSALVVSGHVRWFDPTRPPRTRSQERSRRIGSEHEPPGSDPGAVTTGTGHGPAGQAERATPSRARGRRRRRTRPRRPASPPAAGPRAAAAPRTRAGAAAGCGR